MSQEIDGVEVGELERRMRPGAYSPEGFLEPRASLLAILEADSAILGRLGISATAIADRLEWLLSKGAASDVFSVRVDAWRVWIRHSRKMRTCPWAAAPFERCSCGGGTPFLTTEDFTIRHRRSGESMSGTSLSVHLIRDHFFFGGPGTDYRIDPATAARVLELG